MAEHGKTTPHSTRKLASQTITIDDDARRQAVSALRTWFADEWEQEVGDLKAGLLLDFVITEFGPTLYNQGIADARAYFEQRAADLAAVCVRDEFPESGRRR